MKEFFFFSNEIEFERTFYAGTANTNVKPLVNLHFCLVKNEKLSSDLRVSFVEIGI
jgi:hypothetical protein